MEQDEGVVKLDQGNLAAAQVNVDYTQIRSPIDGRVGLRNVDPGNIVAANGTTGIATITQLQPITVIFTIAEDDLSDVVEQTGTGRTLPVDALDRTKQNKLASGTLITVDNQVNTTTGTVREGHVRQRPQRIVPEPIRQCATDRQDASERRPGSTGGNPAQQRQRFGSMSYKQTTP